MIDAIILIGFFNQLYFYFVLSKREKHLLLTFNNKTFLCDYMSTIVIDRNFVHYFLSEFLNGQENGKVITNKCLNLSKAFYQQNIVNRNPMQILCL